MQRAEALRILSQAIAALAPGRPSRVAIDGIDAAGKTTLADELAALLTADRRSVIRASVDGFHHPAAVRYQRGKNSPEGYYRDSFDYAALTTLLLAPLGLNGNPEIRTEIFDFRIDSAVNSTPAIAATDAILLFDGVFLQRPELAHHWDYVVFVDVSFTTSLERGVQRDLALFGSEQRARERYESRYQPGQRLYFAEAQPRAKAHAILHNDDPYNPELILRI